MWKHHQCFHFWLGSDCMSPTFNLSSCDIPGRAGAWFAKAQEKGLVPRPVAGGVAQLPPLAEMSFPRQLSPFSGSSPAAELCCLLNCYWRQPSKRIINFGNPVFCVPYIVLTIITLHCYCIFTTGSLTPPSVVFVFSAGSKAEAGAAVFIAGAHQVCHMWDFHP